MEDHTIIVFAQWALTGVGLIASGIGIKTIISNWQKRKYEVENKNQARRDTASAVIEANNANQLTADGNLIALLVKRVETLEGEVRDMQKEQLLQARRDATISTKNEHLEKENERQALELKEVRARNRDLTQTVANQADRITKLELKLMELTGSPIDVRLVDGGDAPPAKIEIVGEDK